MRRILSPPRLAKAATGWTAAAFATLARVFSARRAKPLRSRPAEGPSRPRRVGGGGQGQLSDPRHKLAFILCYFRVSPTPDLPGLFFGLRQPQAGAWGHRLTPLLQAALGRELHPKRIELADALPSATRRYGRLQICATNARPL